MQPIRNILLAAALTLIAAAAHAQHTIGVTGGAGMTTGRIYPKQETKALWGAANGGISWRYYSERPRFVGTFGIDLEWMQRGFSYAPYASTTDNKKDYKYYTRRLNTIMLPIVWQPHVYVFRNHMRIYIEAAATFCYNFASTYDNEIEGMSGRYEFKTVRDNRWGYGLAGGGGFAVLAGRFEIGVRVRYYFGYGDLLRNRNKYYDNGLDGAENPFWLTPIRSPLDNLTFNVTLAFRFGRDGFAEWNVRPLRKGKKAGETFNYQLN